MALVIIMVVVGVGMKLFREDEGERQGVLPHGGFAWEQAEGDDMLTHFSLCREFLKQADGGSGNREGGKS